MIQKTYCAIIFVHMALYRHCILWPAISHLHLTWGKIWLLGSQYDGAFHWCLDQCSDRYLDWFEAFSQKLKTWTLHWKPTSVFEHRVTFSTLIMLEMKLICWCLTVACVFQSESIPLRSALIFAQSAETHACVCCFRWRPEGQNVKWSLSLAHTRAGRITNELPWRRCDGWRGIICVLAQSNRPDWMSADLNIWLHGKEP